MVEKYENKKQDNGNGQQWDSLSSIPFNKAEAFLSDIAGDIASADVTVYERLNASNDAAAKEENYMDVICEMSDEELYYPLESSSYVRKVIKNQIPLSVNRKELENLYKNAREYACKSIVDSLKYFENILIFQVYFYSFLIFLVQF